MADLANEEKPAIAPPVFVFQKDKAQKRPAEGSSAEDGEDSDKDESSYCPPAKRERRSSITQFPPAHSVSKNNVFMPSSFCQSPTGNNNSDSEPEEKMVGFRLKPPTLIHGQAPSAGVPSQKPKEQQRSVLRPAVLQAPPAIKSLSQTGLNSGTNGVNRSSEGLPVTQNSTENCDGSTVDRTKSQEKRSERDESRRGEQTFSPMESTFVFGQNVKDRAKVIESSELKGSPSAESGETNYFLQYISTPSLHKAENNTDDGAKFVFGQNMSDRVLSPPKCEQAAEGSTDPQPPPPCDPPLQDSSSEKDNSVTESLEESAAAYTKATAKRCLLEKVEVRTGEESESNVLQVQCKLFVFDKASQSWVERGRGLLRLNDMASTEEGLLQSRLVMRTQGSLRLILNTKLWPQMQADKASEKSVRITAMDTEDQGVKVFLISASSKDTGQLYAALHHRILALRSHSDQEPEPRAPIPDSHIPHPQSNEEDSDEDDPLTSTANTTEEPETPAAGSGGGSS
ncbi:ran-binding protein 3a isoform X2 [Esox lucius]|uniref:Ran-binding protein 3 n=1 Tax=Esox lucius TaxID=8010 RepID=A0A3P8Z1X8_ESOLU|nr:ran-binding protein 3a isoform X2 [Esox lucius]